MFRRFIALAILIANDYAEETIDAAHPDFLIGADHVLRGAHISHLQLHIPTKPIGELMFTSLKKAPPDFLMMVESETGRKTTAKDMFLSCSKLAWAMKHTYDIGETDRVAIIGENSIDINIAGCATYFLGAIMSPINPLLDAETYAELLRKVSPKLIIADVNIAELLKNNIDQDELTSIISVQPSPGCATLVNLISDVSDEDAMRFHPAKNIKKNQLASIVFTSGASGLPKGVAMTHYALLYQATLLSRGKTGTRINILTYWIIGLLAMIDSTINGVTRILVKNTDNTTAILAAIDTYKPNRLEMPPPLVASILKHPQVGNFNLTSVNDVIFAGSQHSPYLFDKVKKFMPSCNITRIYEMTEVTGFLSVAQPPISYDLSSIGMVVPGFHVKVVDPSTNEVVRAGGQGEIWCKGPSMMLGYVTDKDELKQGTDAGGWLSTGDMGGYTTQGLLYITGRTTAIINVDGNKVSAEEIENVIFQLESVDDAVVTSVHKKSVTTENLIMALVVPKATSSASEKEIVDLVKDTLSEWKQLSAGVRFVSCLPRTPTGKLRRRAVHEAAQKLYHNRMLRGDEQQCFNMTNLNITTGCLYSL